jgi:hypothetical protein
MYRELKKKRLLIDGGKCGKCGRTDCLTIHHVLPKHAGGKDEIDNLVTLCDACHRAEHLIRKERKAHLKKVKLDLKSIKIDRNFDIWASGILYIWFMVMDMVCSGLKPPQGFQKND